MRLFVAVEVPPFVRDAVAGAVAPLRAGLPGLRWVDPSRYHLTVVFLGSVGDSEVGAISDGVAAGCAGFAPFTLRLDGRIGTFGRRVVWAGLQRSPELTRLAGSVAGHLPQPLELRDEAEFTAHLTLARANRERVRLGELEAVAIPEMAWTVERVVLMRSAGGYEVVASFPLVADT